MKQTCPTCQLVKSIEEENFAPNSIQKVRCSRCGTEMEFTIPKKEPKIVQSAVVQEPQKDTVVNKKIQELERTVAELSKQKQEAIAVPIESDPPQKKSSPNKGIALGLLLILLCVGGYFYYSKIYLPNKIDREAPRYYTYVQSCILRSSKEAGVEYNKVMSLPYGSELITYSYGQEWSDVKVGEQKGAIASNLLLPKKAFTLLNSVFGNVDSKECVLTGKCRLALLNYYTEKGYVGKIAADHLKEFDANFTLTNDNQWQVFCRPASVKPNSVYFARLINKESKFTDFAVLISNIVTNEKKLLVFTFADDETPQLAFEIDATGHSYIRKLYTHKDYDGSLRLTIDYAE